MSQNCQNKQQISAAINQMKSDEIFDYSSEQEVAVLLQKISATEDILLEMATKSQKTEEVTAL
jgi:sporulation protein YlmC with PRC-barrel domain